MTEDTIRTRRIELLDENGDPSVVLTGTGEHGPGLVVQAAGTEIRLTLGVYNRPSVHLERAEGGSITVGFVDVEKGEAVIQLVNEDGTSTVLTP